MVTFLAAVTCIFSLPNTMITTNLEFTEWASIFGDEKMTAALLDRLTHRAHILLLNGES
ncbi:ATP-binding protein [Bacillus sp. USDA818B3_A]|uniref:ATP-binding protein n=1 Tax=Bacillus sp. USDA818B3_A TaxID=2698834 RepID=UPI002351A933|nr:ATP-binding protein [Bacillus sp. USDA818B3_A]